MTISDEYLALLRPIPAELHALREASAKEVDVCEGQAKEGVVTDRVTSSFASTSTSTSFAVGSGDWLKAWDFRRDVADQLAILAGISAIEGVVSTLSVGGVTIEVELWLDTSNRYVWLIRSGWPTAPARKSLCHAELYAALITGELKRRRKSELARFKIRMLGDLGLWHIRSVALGALPSDATPEALAVWDALAPFLAVRRLCEPESEPFALSAPWFAKWTGIDLNIIRNGKRWLERSGNLVRYGTAPSGFPNETVLWQISRNDRSRLPTPTRVEAPGEQDRECPPRGLAS